MSVFSQVSAFSQESHRLLSGGPKTGPVWPSASKSVKPFGHETDFNGDGSNGTWEISFILDLFCRKRSWYLVVKKWVTNSIASEKPGQAGLL